MEPTSSMDSVFESDSFPSAIDPPSVMTVPSAQPPRRSRQRLVVLAGCVMAGVLIGGLVLGQPDADGPDAGADAVLPEPAMENRTDPAALAAEPGHAEFTRIDELLVYGRYTAALEACREQLEPGGDKQTPALVCRTALCLQGLGRWDEAAAEYARVRHAASVEAVVAAIGRVRCAIEAKDFEAATRHLSELVLVSGAPAFQEHKALEEAVYLRAFLAVARLRTPPAPDPFDATTAAWPPFDEPLERLLKWLAPVAEKKDAPEPGQPADQPLQVDRAAPGVEAQLVSARQAKGDALRLVQDLARQAGLGLHVSAEAEARLSAYRTAVVVDELPVPELLDALAEPNGVAWRIRGTSLELEVPEGPSPRTARAQEVLRRAIAAYPEHLFGPTAAVTLGNLALRERAFREAARWYRRVLVDFPHSPATRDAAFNLGLTLYSVGEFAAAGPQFREAIDRSDDPVRAALGWWWLGRSHLDAAEPAPALQAFRKALALRSGEVRGAAVVGTAAAHLILGDDRAAAATLEDYRSFLRGASVWVVADFLDALGRFRSGGHQSAGRDLLSALPPFADGRAFGLAGIYLAGQAYRELGQDDRMIALYEAAAEHAKGVLAVRMTLAVAEYLDELGEVGPARQRYLAVAAAGPGEPGAIARFRLAGLALRAGSPDDCLALCRTVIDSAGVDRRELLRLMGRAYERKQQPLLAAQCFAGTFPEGVRP